MANDRPRLIGAFRRAATPEVIRPGAMPLKHMAYRNETSAGERGGGGPPVEEEAGEGERGRSGFGSMSAMQGSDMNYDQAIGEDNESAFAAKYLAQSPAADLNTDGHVDEVDVALCIEGLE